MCGGAETVAMSEGGETKGCGLCRALGQCGGRKKRGKKLRENGEVRDKMLREKTEIESDVEDGKESNCKIEGEEPSKDVEGRNGYKHNEVVQNKKYNDVEENVVENTKENEDLHSNERGKSYILHSLRYLSFSTCIV